MQILMHTESFAHFKLKLVTRFLISFFSLQISFILILCGGSSCLKDQMLEKFRPIQIAKLSFLLAKCLSHKIEVNINKKCFKSVENIQKIIQIAGYNRNNTQINIKIYEFKFIRIFKSWKLICFLSNRSVLTLTASVCFLTLRFSNLLWDFEYSILIGWK